MIGVMVMAININTGNLTTPQYNTYKIEKFNGVDYTTTPTKVDGTRAIDMSNYLPMGTSLVKRYGIEKIGELLPNYLTTKIAYIKGRKFEISVEEDLDCNMYNVFVTDVETYYTVDTSVSMDNGFDGIETIVLEGRLFFLTCKNYFVFSYTMGDEGQIEGSLDIVTDIAYVPTLLVALGNDNSSIKSRVYEPINLLSNKFKVKMYYDLSKMGTQRFSIGNYYNKAIKVVSFGGKTEANPSGQFNLPYYPTNTQISVPIIFSLRYNDKAVNYFGSNYVLELTSDTTSTQYTIEGLLEIEVVFEMQDFNPTLVTHATKMIRYGVQQGDTLFFGCNQTYPNVDVHTSIIETTEESWKKYTYVPDDSYQAFGDSNTAVIGYGILNNGHMIIVKESEGNEPNVYTRSGQYYTETITYDLVSLGSDGKETTKTLSFPYTDIRYPTFITGCFVNATKDSKMVYYDNKVFISNQDGVYNIVLNDSTATQTYSAYEFSYSIRANLSRDISHSDAFVYDNRLFIYRKDKNGKYRLYVADKSRYLYHNDKLQYEWWVLDGFGDESVFSVDNEEVHIANKNGIYVYGRNTTFLDTDRYVTSNVKTGNHLADVNDAIFFDTNVGVIFSPHINSMQDILNSDDRQDAQEDFKRHTKIAFNTDIVQYLECNLIESTNDSNEYITKFGFDDKEIYSISTLEYIFTNTNAIYTSDNVKLESFQHYIELDEDDNYYLVLTTSKRLGSRVGFSIKGMPMHIDDLYCHNGVDYFPMRYCVYSDNSWYYIGENKDEHEPLWDSLFNFASLRIETFPINPSLFANKVVDECVIEISKEINTNWESGYLHLESLDKLKTVTNIYFVPLTERGGKTNVGYRTAKKEVGFLSTAYSPIFSFDDVDFDEFNFGEDYFAKTHSSKKKIKHFSFIQIKMDNNKLEDSTVSLLAFRYKYSKQNKGVR